MEPPVARIHRVVPPRHADAQGMMHASRPASYVEDGVLAWLDLVGGGHEALRETGHDLVVVVAHTEYLGPIRQGDLVEVAVRAVGRGRTSLQLSADLLVDDEVRITSTNTYVVVADDGRAMPPPEPLAAALEGLPAIGRTD
jgi:acyl-CoA thioesterase FadM